jgi:ribosomal protein L31
MSGADRKRVDVYLEMDNIKSIRISGAAEIKFEGSFKADDLDIDISGASSLKDLHVNGKSMEVDCSGASKVSVSGNFSKEVGIEVSGASRMTYTGDSETLEADMSGASSFKCEGKHSTADIKCSGASNAEFAGKVGKAEYECSGASSIDAENYISRTVSVELTGACKTKVHADEDLYYNVSRSSKITYYGDAKLYNRTADYNNVVKGR